MSNFEIRNSTMKNYLEKNLFQFFNNTENHQDSHENIDFLCFNFRKKRIFGKKRKDLKNNFK